MPNYASSYDVMMCEPPELVEENDDRSDAEAWGDYLRTGDATQLLEDYLTEDAGEAFALIYAYRNDSDEAMLEAARKMAVKLESLAEDYVK